MTRPASAASGNPPLSVEFSSTLGSPIADAQKPPRRFLTDILPWLLSAWLHAVLIISTWFVIYAVRQSEADRGIFVAGFDEGREMELPQHQDPHLLPVELGNLPVPALSIDESLANTDKLEAAMQAQTADDLSIVGIGAELTAGRGEFDGMTMGRQGGPRVSFMKLAGEGYRIVYVIDRSGSMSDAFDFLRSELKESIDGLRLNQSFHVILFHSGPPIEAPPRQLVPAIKANKMRCRQFLDSVVPGGQTDPHPAMRRALDLKPDVIYFLTDGAFDEDLVARLRQWNRAKKVKIYTIGYLYAPGEELLKQIAGENGGSYRFVDAYR